MAVTILVGTAFGFLSGLGIGGGSLLILWLTQVQMLEQTQARILNLLFFLPSAAVSCLFRWKQGCIPWKRILPSILSGCIAAGVFSFVGMQIDLSLLKKLFGGLLILTGIRELLYKPKQSRG